MPCIQILLILKQFLLILKVETLLWLKVKRIKLKEFKRLFSFWRREEGKK